MSSITLNLDGEALREATTQSIMGILTPEVKSSVIEQAIKALLAPGTDSWNRKKSPIESAFEDAVQGIARKECLLMVQEDEELKSRINQLLRETADKVLNADTEKLTQRMADAFVLSMKSDY